MKMKLFGLGLQSNELVSPGLLLMRSIRKFSNVPDPLSGVTPSLTKAEMRRVLIIPGPLLIMLAATVHPELVRPAALTNGDEKLTTAESKGKSPWKPNVIQGRVDIGGNDRLNNDSRERDGGIEVICGQCDFYWRRSGCWSCRWCSGRCCGWRWSVGAGVGDAVGAGLGDAVGAGVGDAVGAGLGDAVGAGVGDAVGAGLGDAVGAGLGDAVGDGLGDAVGDGLGDAVGDGLGDAVGDGLGDAVGDGLGDVVGDGLGEGVGVDTTPVIVMRPLF